MMYAPRVSEYMRELHCPLCQTRSIERTAEAIPRVGGAREHWTLRCITCQLRLVHADGARLLALWDALGGLWQDGLATHPRPADKERA